MSLLHLASTALEFTPSLAPMSSPDTWSLSRARRTRTAKRTIEREYFGQLMSHIATMNYQFCTGLKNTDTPRLPSPSDKAGIEKFLDDSFAYCSEIITNLSDAQLQQAHDSPDGHLPGLDVLLAMYIHVAHHRGQAEIYLRDNGIKPPGYRI